MNKNYNSFYIFIKGYKKIMNKLNKIWKKTINKLHIIKINLSINKFYQVQTLMKNNKVEINLKKIIKLIISKIIIELNII